MCMPHAGSSFCDHFHESNNVQAFCDLEAFYTYEGTYDVNVLVAGKQLWELPQTFSRQCAQI